MPKSWEQLGNSAWSRAGQEEKVDVDDNKVRGDRTVSETVQPDGSTPPTLVFLVADTGCPKWLAHEKRPNLSPDHFCDSLQSCEE